MEIEDPDSFIRHAVDLGLESFLDNPLLLDILTRAKHAGPRPAVTFGRACEDLVKETNTQHLDAMDGAPYETEQVVRAAGRLCALLLLSDKSGWSRRGPGSDEFPALSEAGDDQPLLKFALATKLFEGSTETGRRPRHRRIAEFLAARYLDHAIRRRRLTPTRALRLLQGIDGIVMPDLRGVSVWLAAMNPGVRCPLIEADPLGVAFQGDAGEFSRRDTERLLYELEARLDHQWEWPFPASLAALMAGPARHLLWELLQDTDRSRGRTNLVAHLLWGMESTLLHGAGEAAFAGSDIATEVRNILPTVVRDSTWQSTVRNQALTVLIHFVGQEADGAAVFRQLLRELDDGAVPEDEGGGLRNELLTYLYPRHLPAGEIWDYAERIWGAARGPVVPRDKGKKFWTEHLVDASAPVEVRTLLDRLTVRADKLNCLLAHNDVESVILRLLARALELVGEQMQVTELYRWFELVRNDYERTGLIPAHCERVRLRSRYLEEQNRIYGWLRDHWPIQLNLILEGVKRTVSKETTLVYSVGLKFLGDKAPSGFREWCLTAAVELAGEAVLASEELAIWAVTQCDEWGPPLPDERVAAAVQSTPSLRKWNERRLAAKTRDAIEHAQRLERPPYTQIRERRQADSASIRGHLPTIEGGRGPLGVFHELGRVYLDGLEAGGPDQARQDLRFRLDSDGDLFTAVSTGFRCLVGRTDLPTLDDITRLHAQNRMSAVAPPFLAGLSEEELAGSDPLQRLDDNGLGRALGFYLLSRLPTRRHPVPWTPNSEDCRPRWYLQALRSHPQAVADAFVAVHRARVASKEPPDQHLYDLVRRDEFERVAPLAVPRMFTPFPSCCTAPQVDTLRPVLWAALKYMSCDDLGRLVLRRLRRKGMDIAQRIHWLAAGLFVEYETCFPALRDVLTDGTEVNVRQLVHCLVPDRDPLPNQEWPAADLTALIKAIGGVPSPPWDDADHTSGYLMAGDALDTRMKADLLISAWVRTLSDRVTEEAIAGLRDLAANPSLKHRRQLFRQECDRQATKRRVLAYEAPTLRGIRDALRDGPPASAVDLAAVVVDQLEALADRIRNSNTDDWQQYWHTDPGDPRGRNVTKPKSEHGCRKALLSDLGLLLEPYGVDVQPEGHHAEERRSDIIAICAHHTVPIEIKKADSRDLWTAIEHQLIPRYLRDPKCGGYGIFLVFWHGHDHLGRSPPNGPPPRSAEELRKQLEAPLTPAQRRTITIVVVDLSAPPGWVSSLW